MTPTPLPGLDTAAPLSGAAVRSHFGPSSDPHILNCWVGRYLGSHPPLEDLSIAEIQDLHAHNIPILLLQEFSTHDLDSPASAVGQAQAAVSEAVSLGVPTNHSVGITLCEDNVNPVSSAVQHNASLGATILRDHGYLAGFYGRKDICRSLLALREVDLAFAVDTWGTTTPADRWNFRQLPNNGTITIGGVVCDIDDAPDPVGLWLPTLITPPTQEETMYGWRDPDGTDHVIARGADSRAGQLLHFYRGPATNNTWQVDDITAELKKQFPNDPAYTVS